MPTPSSTSGRRGGSGARRVRLRREVLTGVAPPRLDDVQLRVVRHRGGPLRVLGAPGTGKTTALVEVVVDRVERDGLSPGSVLVLAPTRLAAATLRELVTARLGRTVQEPLARTPASFAFGVLRRSAELAGAPAPRLITGPEQDVVLRELLAGHLEGAGTDPGWPNELGPALATRGFRGELRDLLMRAVERGVGPDRLAALGREHARPEWLAAARVLQEYLDVTGLATPGGFDPAGVASEAVAALAAEPGLLDAVRDQVRVVVVDDAHELTPAVADLVRVVVGPRPDLVLAGDPDAVTQSFRGADPALLLGTAPGDRPLGSTDLVLATSWRQGPELRAVSRRVADRIGALGGGRQRVVATFGAETLAAETLAAGPLAAGPLAAGPLAAGPLAAGPVPVASVEAVAVEPGAAPRPPARVAVVGTSAHEVAVLADELRRAHLLDGLPWAQMAVVVRGRTRASSLRRGLLQAGVPVDVPVTDLPVRDQPAVVPLLDALEVALAVATGEGEPLPVALAVGLLQSPLGGADAMALRRLRRALRAGELDDGGGRPSDALLVAALLDPARLATVDRFTAAPAARVAAVLAAGVTAARPAGPAARPGRVFDDDVTAETVLWALWSASGVAASWRRTALSGGPAGARADRDLDAVMALFDAAARFVDRLPQAGPRAFVDYLRGQDVPGDSLAERGGGERGVSLTTPASAAGREWSLVCVAGVQDGVWPDLRPRGSLLGSERLVDVLSGRESTARSAAAAVRDDETRLFHVAVSRARERLLVTAVRDDDLQPSALLDLVDPSPSDLPALGWDDDGVRLPQLPPRPLSLPGLVADLRQQLCADPDGPGAASAAERLVRLAAAGVAGADPDDWYGLAPLSDPRPLATDDPVRVSPSRVEAFDTCALRWLLEVSGGRRTTSAKQGLGSLVHALAEELPDADEPTLLAELHRRWGVLELGPGWAGDVQRERAEKVVRKLAGYLARAGSRELVGVELDVDVRVDLPSGPARITGQVDRLERDAAGLRVVDLKTGKNSPRSAEVAEHPQLGTYQLAGRAGAFEQVAPGSAVAGASLVQLGDKTVGPKEQVQDALPDDGGWALELLDRVAVGMTGEVFAATPNPGCDHCPVRSSCPARGEGRAVTA